MARVHHFSTTSPHQEKRTVDTNDASYVRLARSSEGPTPSAQDDSNSLDITAVPSPTLAADHSSPSSSTAQSLNQDISSTTEHITDSSQTSHSSLAAALLNDARNANVVGAVAAALSAKTGKEHTNKSVQQDFGDGQNKTDLMEQAAAATALQLLGLSQNDTKDKSTTKSNDQSTSGNNIMLVADYPGLSRSSPSSENLESKAEDGSDDYRRGTWTTEEDELLLAGIKKYGYGRWKEIASTIPGRKGKQLKQRWDNTLVSKYVDQEWLKNKIRNDEESQQEESMEEGSSPGSTQNHDDVSKAKTNKLFETTDWNHIAQKITEKTREGNNEAIEALLSQALLGTTAASSPSTLPTTSTSNADGTPSSEAFGGHGPSSASTLNFADAAALALYAQHLQQGDSHNSSYPYFLSNPYTGESSNAMAAAAAAAVAAVAQASAVGNNMNIQSNEVGLTSSPTSRSSGVGHKRRRSDPALADTQSAAMSIYASSSPIPTTVDNQTQMVYPCLFPNCGKTFQRLYNLKSHSRTHTDDRPFICRVCQAAFSRNHDLKRHVKIHGGDKPHRCTGCNKKFSRLDALKRHQSNQRNKAACMGA